MNLPTDVVAICGNSSQAGVAVLNGCIYVMGGCEAWNCTPSVEKYCPEENRWTLCAPMQLARSVTSSVIETSYYLKTST